MAMEGTDALLCRAETCVVSRALRVMVDARMLVGAFGGIARYVTRLVDKLAEQDGMEIVALCGAETPSQLPERENVAVAMTNFSRRDRGAIGRLRWEERNLAQAIRNAEVDVFHATWNTGIPAKCPVPAVLTIHDFIPWHSPDQYFSGRLDRWCYGHSMRSSCRRAARVVTVSNYVRREVLDRLGADGDHVVAIHNGVDGADADAVVPPPGERPYVLCVGGFERRKNLTGVFEAMERYWKRFGHDMELRLTGDAHQLLDCDRPHLPRGGDVRFLGAIGDRALAAQYAGARLLLMLSRDEGFGLPVLEAMAHGCPVVAAATTALPEVVGDAGILVQPADADGVADVIRRVHGDAALRKSLAERGRARAGLFGWDRTARSLREVYEAAAGAVRRSVTREEAMCP